MGPHGPCGPIALFEVTHLSARPTPYAYFLDFTSSGHAPSGFTKKVSERELGRVEATYANKGVPTGYTGAWPRLSAGGFPFAVALPTALPGKRTEFYSVASGLSWDRELDEGEFFDPVTVNLTRANVSRPGVPRPSGSTPRCSGRPSASSASSGGRETT